MSLTVVGLGSELSGDDTVGLMLVARLDAEQRDPRITCRLWPDADALTVAHDLLALDEAVLFVDCADMGLPPGSHRLLALPAVRLKVTHSPLSVHGLGVAEALELCRRLGFAQPVHLFAVQPYGLAPGTSLSPEMAAQLPALGAALAQAARDLGSPGPSAAGSAA